MLRSWPYFEGEKGNNAKNAYWILLHLKPVTKHLEKYLLGVLWFKEETTGQMFNKDVLNSFGISFSNQIYSVSNARKNGNMNTFSSFSVNHETSLQTSAGLLNSSKELVFSSVCD